MLDVGAIHATIERSAHTVLVVDDNPVTRYSTARVVRAAGFQTMEAESGAQALQMAGEGISAVVLDVHLPDIDGFAVCRALRTREDTAQLPVMHLFGGPRACRGPRHRAERRGRRLPHPSRGTRGAGGHPAGTHPRAHCGGQPAAQRPALPRHLQPGPQRHRAAGARRALHRRQPGDGARARAHPPGSPRPRDQRLRPARLGGLRQGQDGGHRPVGHLAGRVPAHAALGPMGVPGMEHFRARGTRDAHGPGRRHLRAGGTRQPPPGRCWSASRRPAPRPSA